MSELLDQKQSRREFFRSVGRYLILGGLLGTTGTLLARRKSGSATGLPANIEACRKCTFLRKCDQPAAVLVRKEMDGV